MSGRRPRRPPFPTWMAATSAAMTMAGGAAGGAERSRRLATIYSEPRHALPFLSRRRPAAPYRSSPIASRSISLARFRHPDPLARRETRPLPGERGFPRPLRRALTSSGRVPVRGLALVPDTAWSLDPTSRNGRRGFPRERRSRGRSRRCRPSCRPEENRLRRDIPDSRPTRPGADDRVETAGARQTFPILQEGFGVVGGARRPRPLIGRRLFQDRRTVRRLRRSWPCVTGR